MFLLRSTAFLDYGFTPYTALLYLRTEEKVRTSCVPIVSAFTNSLFHQVSFFIIIIIIIIIVIFYQLSQVLSGSSYFKCFQKIIIVLLYCPEFCLWESYKPVRIQERNSMLAGFFRKYSKLC
jgi:hypothetical protein